MELGHTAASAFSLPLLSPQISPIALDSKTGTEPISPRRSRPQARPGRLTRPSLSPDFRNLNTNANKEKSALKKAIFPRKQTKYDGLFEDCSGIDLTFRRMKPVLLARR